MLQATLSLAEGKIFILGDFNAVADPSLNRRNEIVLWYGCPFMGFRMSGGIYLQTSENILANRKHISRCPELTPYLLKGRDLGWWIQSNIYLIQSLIIPL